MVLGLGDTGLSVARWVEREGGKARVADTRAHPPRGKEFSGELRTGPFTRSLLEEVDLICISPGLALDDGVVQEGLARGLPVVGDVELFAWRNRSAVLAVTGTNGKTTVTALTGHL
ncbi:MAG: UDP-N-acetylmuramoyl-L-alanine--D-glutamate ligase, partial [Pseudomonadota bacterium]|nr:UDP-N-acetylmuramoyl-L-alanine--D-glutamate ligase [Pseudomonadota bacterium]